ncbi:MAG: magnesium transporter [Flavobacteriales bacterium]|nr:magnesium transporter [Flavobacteriales bacterium]
MQFELTKEFLKNLRKQISAQDTTAISTQLNELHAADIAEIMDELETDEIKYLFTLFDGETKGEIFVELEEETLEEFVDALDSEELATQFIENIESDDAASVIAELDDKKREEVIARLEDVDQASDIVDLLTYEEDTAGSLMAKEVLTANINWTVSKCVREIRRQSESMKNMYIVYVVDDNHRLIGIISLKGLVINSPKELITNLINKDVISIRTKSPLEDVENAMEKYDLVALPVVDELGRLVGRITIDDVVDMIKEDAEKTFQIASGISENIEATDSIWLLTRARLPWLLIGLMGGIAGARIIGLYEEEIQIHPEMAFFIPLIAAMGGNVGVQSSAIIVQGLANNSLGIQGTFSRLFKEFSLGITNGIICAILIFTYNYVFSDSIELAITVSTALFCVVIFAAVFGTWIPLILDKYKIDPALATGPFITTANDVLSIFLYFYIGQLMYS